MDTDKQKSGAARFLDIMRTRLGSNRSSLSGPGSALEATTEIRAWLPTIISRYSVSSVADVPCGDWVWMSAVDLEDVEYTGYDLLPELIEANLQKYPDVRFDLLNAITTPPPQVDLIICRDLLVHLNYDHARAVLNNFRKSGSRLLAVTTFPGEANQELAQSHPGWGWRPLDMEAAPFMLGTAIDGVREVVAGERWERWIKLYQL